MSIWENKNLIKILKNNGVAIMPTDTIYGIVGNALNEEVVKRIYNIKKRDLEKSCIVLIGDISELKRFSITLLEKQTTSLTPQEKIIKKFWPGPVSIILTCSQSQDPDQSQGQTFGTSLRSDLGIASLIFNKKDNSIAFRVPDNLDLRKFLLKTGPLVALSANPQNLNPAKNIIEAKKYFAKENLDLIDFYLDGGIMEGKASKIIRLFSDGSVKIIRN